MAEGIARAILVAPGIGEDFGHRGISSDAGRHFGRRMKRGRHADCGGKQEGGKQGSFMQRQGHVGNSGDDSREEAT
ncbi:hypothetical protein NSE01_39970 [Novosphingobium sediminis]|uniref:Uncharacterized protein n=1 Tax=Novosphingobium sediminis TaxID=707214 RepID=A0A512AR26_9SPHN|nr:hypothetical protein NSE01_39970 [Novosphingobium sediminis]